MEKPEEKNHHPQTHTQKVAARQCHRHWRMHRRAQHQRADENPIKQNRSHVRIESMKNYMVVHTAHTHRGRERTKRIRNNVMMA